MTNQDSILLGDYTMRLLDAAELMPLFHAHRSEIFANTFDFNVREALSAEERAASARLRERLGTPYTLNIGVYRGDELAGWSFGWQEGSEKYYMTNTGIFPQHQGKGMYTALLPRILDILKAEGFQIVYSRHTATNNRVLVPKLKAGFIISGFEISDVFGLLVHLSYFFNPLRRKMMDVRAGQSRPDEELKRYLSLE
jgi:hypothetical protein